MIINIKIKLDTQLTEDEIMPGLKRICLENFQKYELEVCGKEKTLKYQNE